MSTIQIVLLLAAIGSTASFIVSSAIATKLSDKAFDAGCSDYVYDLERVVRYDGYSWEGTTNKQRKIMDKESHAWLFFFIFLFATAVLWTAFGGSVLWTAFGESM